MQEDDARRRLAILRGEEPPPIEESSVEARDAELPREAETRPRRGKKERKLPGEDVTDFELRVAKDQISKDISLQAAKTSSSAPLVGRDGHIDLLGDEKARRQSEKNGEVERKTDKGQRQYEDQFSMRLSNAAGKDGVKAPWYTASGELSAEFDPPAKDVWGNEDPRRREREVNRLAANDPLLMMKSGAAKVREVNKARRAAQQERAEELRKLKKEQRRRERHERKEEERRHRRRREDGRRSEGDGDGHRHRSERRDSDRRRRSSSPRREHRCDERRRY